jgi:hypothetical protein
MQDSNVISLIEQYCQMTDIHKVGEATYRGMREDRTIMLTFTRRPNDQYVVHAFDGPGGMAMSQEHPYLEMALKTIPWRNLGYM